MSPTVMALLGIGLLLVLMFARMPIAFAMFLVGFVGLWLQASPQAAMNIIRADIWGGFSSYGMSVVPLFVLMGNITFRSGVARDVFDAAYRWLGHIRGGMAGTVIAASTGFAAISGSNSATAATMGTISLPLMEEYEYDDALSTGSVAVGGTLGVVIPPSVVLIVIALQAEQSIAKLFLGAVIPGLILSSLFIATIWVLCRRNPQLGPAGERSTWKERFLALGGVVETVILFSLVLGGMYAGWFTPTEAGAAGSFGALAIALIRRRLGWQDFWDGVRETLQVSAMVIFLVAGAVVLGRFLTYTRLPVALAEWVVGLNVPDVGILLVVILVYLVGGMFTDALGFLTLSVPVFFPLAASLGYDLVWFSILITIVTTLGAITPPVGICLFIVKGLKENVGIQTIVRGAAWFVPAYVVTIALLILFPQIVLVVVN